MDQTGESLLPRTNQEASALTNSGPKGNFISAILRSLVRHVSKIATVFRSGQLLKAIFVVHGLRDPRKAGFGAAVFTLIWFFTDLLYFVEQLFSTGPWLCSKLNTDLSYWLCDWNGTMNSSGTVVSNLVHGTNRDQALLLAVAFTQLLSHTVFLFCLFALDKKENALQPQDLFNRLSNRTFWLHSNFLLVFWALGLSSLGYIYLTEYHVPIVIPTYFKIITFIVAVWRSTVNCCLFSLIMVALEHRVEQCKNEIRNSHLHRLDDAIQLHQHLCAQVFSTSDALRPWFIIHWCGSVVVGAFFVAAIPLMHQILSLSWYSSWMILWGLGTFLFLFVYPCYCATSVTSKCRQILNDFNMSNREDWRPGHPFHQPCQLLQFIQYAEYSRCGFRVGSITFGSSYAWMSTLISLWVGSVQLL